MLVGVLFILGGIALAWLMWLFSPKLLYMGYPVFVGLVWIIAPLTLTVAVVLSLKNWRKSKPKRLLLVTTLAILLDVAFIGTHLFSMPIAHVLKVTIKVSIQPNQDDLNGSQISSNSNERERLLPTLLRTTQLIEAPKPQGHADYTLYLFIDDRDEEYRALNFEVPGLCPVYTCPYYSNEGVIGNPLTKEYVYAPEAFRSWIQAKRIESGHRIRVNS